MSLSQVVASNARLRPSDSNSRLQSEGTRPYPDSHDDHTYAVLDSPDQPFRRVDSCGSLDSRRQRSPIMMGQFDQLDTNTLPAMTGVEKMRRTKSASSTTKNPRRKDMLKSKSPPARQPSPLVTDSQQPVYHVLQQPGSPISPQEPVPSAQEPVYHILQQPGSPNQLVSPSPPVYEVLHTPSPPPTTTTSQQQPVYQVLEQPSHTPQPRPAFQHEEFKPVSLSGRSGSGKGSLVSSSGNSKGSSHSLHCRPLAPSTTNTHHKHHIDTTDPSIFGGCKLPPSDQQQQWSETSPGTCESLV